MRSNKKRTVRLNATLIDDHIRKGSHNSLLAYCYCYNIGVNTTSPNIEVKKGRK